MNRAQEKKLVDELGLLAAQAAKIEEQARAIKAKLIEAGRDSYEGEFYRATVSKYEQTRLNMEAVRAKLSPQFIARNSETTPVTKVMVKARSAALVGLQ